MVSDQEKTVNDMIICNSLIAAWLLLLSLTGCLERIHLPFPNPLPINVRIFEYDKNDLIIDWSAAGTVTRLERPTIAIPKGSEKWLEPVYFFAKNLKFLSRKHHELNRLHL